jgi:hypothetical protein
MLRQTWLSYCAALVTTGCATSSAGPVRGSRRRVRLRCPCKHLHAGRLCPAIGHRGAVRRRADQRPRRSAAVADEARRRKPAPVQKNTRAGAAARSPCGQLARVTLDTGSSSGKTVAIGVAV